MSSIPTPTPGPAASCHLLLPSCITESAQALTPDPAPSNAPGTRNQPHEFPWSQAGTGWPFKCAPPMPDTSPKKIILACKSTLGLEAGTCSWGHNLLLCSHPTNRTLFKCFIYFKSFFFMFVFIWLGQVLAWHLGIFTLFCSMCDLVS